MESLINKLLVALYAVILTSIFVNALYVRRSWIGVWILKDRNRRIKWYMSICKKYKPFPIISLLMVIAVLIVILSMVMSYLGSPEYYWLWLIWGCLQAGWFLILNWLYLVAACEEISITG
jgi:hypothetical protein